MANREMPMADGGDISVRLSELVQHGSHVDSVSDLVGNVRRAGYAIRLGRGAYGWLCAGVPVLLDGLQSRVLDCLTEGVGSLRDTEGFLRTTAADFQSLAEMANDRLDRLQGPGGPDGSTSLT